MDKRVIWLGMFVGSLVGAYVPNLWGDDSLFSLTSVFTSAIGAFIGVWLGFRLTH
jgi:uncharacterized membrane protein YeaQ/YmgE (transglycosylase-associated protein family)